MPPGWAPGPDVVDRARALGIDADREARRFTAWCRANGTIAADFDARFELWIEDSARRAPPTAPATPVSAAPPAPVPAPKPPPRPGPSPTDRLRDAVLAATFTRAGAKTPAERAALCGRDRSFAGQIYVDAVAAYERAGIPLHPAFTLNEASVLPSHVAHADAAAIGDAYRPSIAKARTPGIEYDDDPAVIAERRRKHDRWVIEQAESALRTSAEGRAVKEAVALWRPDIPRDANIWEITTVFQELIGTHAAEYERLVRESMEYLRVHPSAGRPLTEIEAKHAAEAVAGVNKLIEKIATGA